MYCSKCGRKIESTTGVCYYCTSDPVFHGPVFPCVECATLRSRINSTEVLVSLMQNVIQNQMNKTGKGFDLTVIEFDLFALAHSVQKFIKGDLEE